MLSLFRPQGLALIISLSLLFTEISYADRLDENPGELETNSLLDDEVVTFSLSERGTLKRLVLPSFRGTLLHGGNGLPVSLDDLHKRTGKDVSKLRLELAALARKRSNDFQLYRKLQAIKLSVQSLDKENLKKAFYGTPDYRTSEEYARVLSWQKTAGYVAMLALSDESYRKYFCARDACNIENDRIDQLKGVGLSMNLYWGGRGNKNEFQTRRLINEYVDNEFSELVEWSKNHEFRTDEYIVGNVQLPNYQFQKGHFDIQLPLRSVPYEKGTPAVVHKFVAMSAKEAEALVNKQQNQPIYYLFRISPTPVNSAEPNAVGDDPYGMKYEYRLVSDTTEVFFDAKLKDKWMDVSVAGDDTSTTPEPVAAVTRLDIERMKTECGKHVRGNTQGTSPWRLAVACARQCQTAGEGLLYQLPDAGQRVSECTSSHDKFKETVHAESAAAANNAPRIETKNMTIAVDVIGRLGQSGDHRTVRSRATEFMKCSQGKFQMADDAGRAKLSQIRNGATVKLIGIHYAVDYKGTKTSECLVSDIEVLDGG